AGLPVARLQTPYFFPSLINRSSSDRLCLGSTVTPARRLRLGPTLQSKRVELAPSTCPNCGSRTTPYSQDAIETVPDVTKLFPVLADWTRLLRPRIQIDLGSGGCAHALTQSALALCSGNGAPRLTGLSWGGCSPLRNINGSSEP
ncbi:unnamed protein product, partial [Mycena citricolor]